MLGAGVTGLAGVALLNGREHDWSTGRDDVLTPSLEATSGFCAADTLFSTASLVGWKWY